MSKKSGNVSSLIIVTLCVILFAGCGDDESVGPKTEAPVLTTATLTGITQTTAQCGGDITSNGGAPVTARGVCWSTDDSPTVADSITTDSTGTGSFVSSITGLEGGVTYHVRAYATNSAGTGYGGDSSFTTAIQPPELTTASVSSITQTTAHCGGDITSNGGAPVTARGVCWSTDDSPTVADNITTDSTGTGSFVSSITGLEAGYTYHVRAYATNSVGTAYGVIRRFMTNSGLFAPQVEYTVGSRSRPFSVFSIDLNGDGNNDLATANSVSDNVSILLGNGDGTFQSAVNYAAGDYPYSVFSIDFDGDGYNDLATANNGSGNVSILLGNGDGTFQSAVNYAVGVGINSVFSADFNSDGNNDLAAANGVSDNVSILLGNGDGTFQSVVIYAAGDGPNSVFSIDLNGDGNNDLVTANINSANVSILLGNGDGTFQSAVNYAAGDDPNSVFSIDLNGDGNNDLATANWASDNVSILLGNGDGTFQSAVNYAAGRGPLAIFSIDLNGDGNNDLATANVGSENVSILLGNGDGTFKSAINYSAGGRPVSVFSIDFDGDGDNDLATANWWSDNVSILLNTMQ